MIEEYHQVPAPGERMQLTVAGMLRHVLPPVGTPKCRKVKFFEGEPAHHCGVALDPDTDDHIGLHACPCGVSFTVDADDRLSAALAASSRQGLAEAATEHVARLNFQLERLAIRLGNLRREVEGFERRLAALEQRDAVTLEDVERGSVAMDVRSPSGVAVRPAETQPAACVHAECAGRALAEALKVVLRDEHRSQSADAVVAEVQAWRVSEAITSLPNGAWRRLTEATIERMAELDHPVTCSLHTPTVEQGG